MTTWTRFFGFLTLTGTAVAGLDASTHPPGGELPSWLLMVGGAVGGGLLVWGTSMARRTATRLRNDKDPKNDWIADALDAFADIKEHAHENNLSPGDEAARLRELAEALRGKT